MTTESKEIEPKDGTKPTVEDDVESGEDEATEATGASTSTSAPKKKKKKSKTKKLKDALTGNKSEEPKTAADLSSNQFEQLLAMNPALRNELKGMDQSKLAEMMKKISLADTLTGMSVSGKNQKDMASYKFWSSQPVPTFEEAKVQPDQEGPIRDVDISRVSKEPPPMVEGFEWVTMDLDDDAELQEVYELLSDHYVEDNDATFRFHYSAGFFTWALKSPGWQKEWHVGVRASKSRKLVAFISAIPVQIRVRQNLLKASEVNFLCIHKKLRNKRLAPVLIKEITRRSNLMGTFQGLYTGGVLLPSPIATCRYYHRSLDWQKLYEVGFSPLPPGSTPLRQAAKFRLPTATLTPGLRELKADDVPAVADLLTRYLKRFDMGQIFSGEEVTHWLLHNPEMCPERVVYSYVVTAPESGKITDFISFYKLASTVIGSKTHKFVNASYLYYYATETAFGDDADATKKRLNALVKDALILAKGLGFDVMNALSLLDNPLFLDEQLFGAGDGQLHYYLYNYRAAPIDGGLGKDGRASSQNMGGVGVVML